MTSERFVVQEDANTNQILLLIDKKQNKMWSFLAEEKEAVEKICTLLNKQDKEIIAQNSIIENQAMKIKDQIEIITNLNKTLFEVMCDDK